MRRLVATMAGAWLCAAGATAGAQTIRGAVAGTAGGPLPGVVVLLVDSATKEVARSLSNERGEYVLTAPRPGTYRLRTLRIGFRSVITPPIALAAGQEVTRPITLADIAFTLDTVRAIGRNACRLIARDSTSMVAALWDQVRSALIATQLGLNTRVLYLTTLTYERTTHRLSQRIGRQSIDARSAYATQPWRAVGIDSLRRAGYVYNEGELRTYNAPDLGVLLSVEFLEDHCLRVGSGSTAQRVAIDFEPTPDRGKFTEIRGTLWLDRATNELRELEYRYANIPRDEERIAEGRVGFTRMRNGMWAISGWNIRMPIFVSRSVPASMRVDRSIDSVQVTGGELVLATLGRGRDTLWARPPMSLSGVVLDSLSGRPVANAVVWLDGTVQVDTADGQGRFAIHGVLPGRYVVNATSPSLDSVNTVNQRSLLVADSSMSATIRVPNASMIANEVCGEQRERDPEKATGFAVGTVTRGDGSPVPNASVYVKWDWFVLGASERNPINTQHLSADTKADAKGAFRICGLPINTLMTFVGVADSVESEPLKIRIPLGLRFTRVGLTVGRVATKQGTFIGTVVDSTQQRLADVDVQLTDIGLSARTDARGTFRITGIVPGSHRVIVRRVGYGVLDGEIYFEAGRPIERRIVLTRLTVLDSVLTTSNRNRDPLMEEFEENRKKGLGHFVTRDDILKMEGALLSSFLRQLSDLKLVTSQSGDYVFGSRPSPCTTARPGPADVPQAYCEIYYMPSKSEARQGVPYGCFARVYMDAQLMNPGVPTTPFNLREVVTSQVEAMEYYASAAQVPAKYLSRNSSCGLLIIHTRRAR